MQFTKFPTPGSTEASAPAGPRQMRAKALRGAWWFPQSTVTAPAENSDTAGTGCALGPSWQKERADLQIEECVRGIRTVLRGCLPAPGKWGRTSQCWSSLTGLEPQALPSWLGLLAPEDPHMPGASRASIWELTPPGLGTQQPTASQTPMLISWLALPNLPIPRGTPLPTAQAILPSLTSGLTL